MSWSKNPVNVKLVTSYFHAEWCTFDPPIALALQSLFRIWPQLPVRKTLASTKKALSAAVSCWTWAMTEQRYLLVSVEQTSSSPWRSNIFMDIQRYSISVGICWISVGICWISIGICWYLLVSVEYLVLTFRQAVSIPREWWTARERPKKPSAPAESSGSSSTKQIAQHGRAALLKLYAEWPFSILFTWSMSSSIKPGIE